MAAYGDETGGQTESKNRVFPSNTVCAAVLYVDARSLTLPTANRSAIRFTRSSSPRFLFFRFPV